MIRPALAKAQTKTKDMTSLLEVYNEENATAPPYGQAHPARRILVVEDDEAIRRFSTRELSRSGYQVDAAEDGAVAWDTLQLHDYDLVVTDNNMPKVTGVGLLKMLRAARMDVPVIMVSGAVPTEELNRYPSLRLAATLSKPFSDSELLLTVRKVLRTIDSARGQMVPLFNTQARSPAERLCL